MCHQTHGKEDLQKAAYRSKTVRSCDFLGSLQRLELHMLQREIKPDQV